MTKENLNKYITTPKTYEVKYVEQHQQKSKLSPAARGKKVVNNGSYVSSRATDLVPSYGPCSTCEVSDKKFRLTMNLRNMAGSHLTKTVNDVNSAADEASNIISGTDGWEGTASTGVFRAKNRNNLAKKVNEAVAEHVKDKGVVVIKTVTNDVDGEDKDD